MGSRSTTHVLEIDEEGIRVSMSQLHRRGSETDEAEAVVVETVPTRLTRSKIYALIAVCLMSVGSHFAMYLLGPLKSRLHREMGTSNSQFSLLIASFNLNSTWTPLVAGLFVTRFGTAWSSVATTFCVLAGQIVLFSGVATSHLIIMTLGLFTFGLGTTPLSVVQETLISHLTPSNHIGLSLALGLVSGKSSSFISSSVSLPLADWLGDLAPFAVAVSLCLVSFVGNGIRLGMKWGMEDGRHVIVKEKRGVSWGGVGDLGDVFWLYILLNILSGAIWQPFLHLSANLLQNRYKSTEAVASQEASVLLAGAIILYPIVGYLTDRFNPSTPRTTFILLQISSVLTLLAYTYILLPPTWTGSPWIAMFLFTTGYGMATLLLVILVPRLLPPQYIPLGLGLHKSMEMASSSLSQTLAGLWLDWSKKTGTIDDNDDNDDQVDGDEYGAGEGLLRVFWMINILQLGCIFLLWRSEARRRRRANDQRVEAEEYEQLPMEGVNEASYDDDEEDEDNETEHDDLNSSAGGSPLTKRVGEEELGGTVEEAKIGSGRPPDNETSSALVADDNERRRARRYLFISLGFIVLVWVLFLVSAWSRL